MDNDRHLDDPDGNGGDGVVEKDEEDVDKYIMIQCLWRFCLFLPCSPPPSKVVMIGENII